MISYRRKDSVAYAGRIHDRLTTEFGSDNVYFDIDSIPLGVDFRQVIDQMVARCDVVLVVMGPQWLTIRDKGKRRLDMEGDYVRLEVQAALRRGIPVIPVLVAGAKMPNENQLPDVLAELAYRNATEVRHDPDFHSDVDRLISGLRSRPSPQGKPPKSKSQASKSSTTTTTRKSGGAVKRSPRTPSQVFVANTKEAIASGEPTDAEGFKKRGIERQKLKDYSGAISDFEASLQLKYDPEVESLQAGAAVAMNFRA
jgi:TIR domain